MKNEDLRVQSVLCELKKFASKENEITSLTTLNKIISSSQEDVDFLYNSNGIDIIMSFLENDCKLTNICLKILANASKRHKNVRSKLLENNILDLLAVKLKSEADFSSSNLTLYSALIVVLLQGNHEAQNRMRTSGCLSSVVYILSCILDETENKSLPPKTTELIIYTIIASTKYPRHIKNQTEVGWITPKILEYLEKQTIFSGSNQLHIIKCFWFFIKIVLDRNELNQQIFLSSLGFGVLFRSIQGTVEVYNCEETTDLLVKMTGVLIKFKYNKEFLSQASNYCPVMILASVLKTCNSCLVLQQTITFLDSLTLEFPRALEILRDSEISKTRKKAITMLLKSRAATAAVEICLNLWNRLEISQETPATQDEHYLSSNLKFGLDLVSKNQDFRVTPPKSNFLKFHFCVVHDFDLIPTYQDTSEPSFKHTNSSQATVNKERIESLAKIRFSSANLRRKKLKEKERKLRKVMSQNLFHLPKVSENRFNILAIACRKIKQTLKKFFSFFDEE